jgi:Holliday junction resolvase
MNPSEAEIQRAIIDTLRWDGWLVIRVNQGAMKRDNDLIRFAYWSAPGQDETHAGISDVIAFKDNMPDLIVEVKVPGKRPTAAQAAFLEACREAGKVGIVATSVDDLAPWLERVTV